jgi:Fe-S cluster assembly scaffold protein SufB
MSKASQLFMEKIKRKSEREFSGPSFPLILDGVVHVEGLESFDDKVMKISVAKNNAAIIFNSNSFGHGRCVVNIESGAKLTWVSKSVGAAHQAQWSNIEVHLDDGAAFEWLGVNNLAAGTSMAEQIDIKFNGADANAKVISFFAQENGSSVVQEVNGEIKPASSRCSFEQKSKVLKFGEQSHSLIEPNLKIENDSVKASHGAAHSGLDVLALNAIQSRGFTLDEAKSFLRESFLMSGLLALSFPAHIYSQLAGGDGNE